MSRLGTCRKFAVAAATAAGEALSLGVLHGTAANITAIAVAAAGAFGVFQVPNSPAGQSAARSYTPSTSDPNPGGTA